MSASIVLTRMHYNIQSNADSNLNQEHSIQWFMHIRSGDIQAFVASHNSVPNYIAYVLLDQILH